MLKVEFPYDQSSAPRGCPQDPYHAEGTKHLEGCVLQGVPEKTTFLKFLGLDHLDHFPPFGPICTIWITLGHLDQFGPLWTTLDHSGPFGPLWTIWTILDHFGPFGPLWTTLDHFGPLWTTFDHFGSLWTTLYHFGPRTVQRGPTGPK